MQRMIILATLVLFGALTVFAVWREGGVMQIFASVGQNYGSIQIFVDLVIALMLVNVWIWRDARKMGRNPLPWVLATLVAGSFSPLLYLLTRRQDAEIEE